MKKLFAVLICLLLLTGFSMTSFAGGLADGEVDSTPVQPLEESIQTRDALVIGGIYTIRLGSSNKMLNVNSGIDANGTTVNVWTSDGSIEQKFKVVSGSSGTYRLQAMCSNSGRVIDAYRPIKDGCKVDIWLSNDAPAQDLYITSVSNGYYTIRLASYPTLYLTATGTSNGSAVKYKTKATNYSNQKWNLECIQTIDYGDMNWQYPLPGHYNISCGFQGYAGHKGIDISDSQITSNYLTLNFNVKSASAGTVNRVFADISQSYGNGYCVAIESNNIDPNTSRKLIYTYAHLREAPTLTVGSTIAKNVTVGFVGNTGNSTGAHLHMQVNKAGSFYTDNINDFINPILFYPNINFTGNVTRGFSDSPCILESHGLTAHDYINNYIVDISLINHVGIKNFENWWADRSDNLSNPHSEKTLSSFLAYFKIDEELFNTIAQSNSLNTLYDIEYVSNCIKNSCS